MHRRLLALALLSATAAGAQITVGTRSADDHSREEAAAARINAAESALEKGDFPAAEAALRVLATERPKDAHVLYDLGFAQERNGEDADAAKSYSAAAAADPKLAEPRVALGLLEARIGHADDGRKYLEAAAGMTEAAPDLRGRAFRALARLDSRSNPTLASDELLQAIKLTGETPEDAALTAELAGRSGDSAAAATAYRKALASNAGDVEAAVGLARLLRKDGKTGEAEDLLRNAPAEDPRVVAELSDIYAAEGRLPEAIALVEGLRAKNPEVSKSAAMTALLARLDMAAGKYAEAEPLYRSLAAQTPDDPQLLDDLGGALLRQAKYAESERILSQAYGMRAAFHDDAAWAETATHLALAAQRNHDPQVALQALATRATVLPDSAASLFLQATAHDALHHNKDAERLYRAFLAKAGGKFPDEEFEARHRLIALDHEK